MEPQFQNSFIPKNPVAFSGSGGDAPKTVTVNIFSSIAGFVLVVTLLASGGLFVYKNILVNGIASADTELNAARKAFEPEKIAELISANASIAAATELLNKHVVISKVLTLMQQVTLQTMRLSDLIYTNKDGKPTLTSSVEAQSYNALAQEFNTLSTSAMIKNPLLSNFSLGSNGLVRANMSAELLPDFVSYKNSLTVQ
jgi:hypothetical protein